jgi:hypothetical protein
VTEWFVRRDFSTASDFLDALSAHRMWGHRPDWWLFRGQGDARLGAPAERLPEAAQLRLWARAVCSQAEHREQIVQEALLMRLFVSGINEQGGELPSEAAFGLTNWREIDQIVEAAAPEEGPLPATVWPPPQLQQLFALGQHYGLPTRLLDWTERGRVAAYFAAEAAQRMREAGSAALADRSVGLCACP